MEKTDYEVTTTSMRKIKVKAINEEEAINIASTQYKDGEVMMMISSDSSI